MFVCIIGPHREGPLCICCCKDRQAEIERLQPGNPSKLKSWSFREYPTQDAHKALSIIKRYFYPSQIQGDWFNISVDQYIQALNDIFGPSSKPRTPKQAAQYLEEKRRKQRTGIDRRRKSTRGKKIEDLIDRGILEGDFNPDKYLIQDL